MASKHKIRLTCSRCNKIGLFHTVDEINYKVIGFNISLNEEYYECPECNRKDNKKEIPKEVAKEKQPIVTYQEISLK